jgi:ATP-dependent Clp protease ATP-binding subunit ClpA
MTRLISSRIKEPLVEEILFGRLAGGGRVLVGAEGDLTLTYEAEGER